jgi:hypothetical protein
MRQQISTEAAASMLRASASRALARAVVCGIDEAAQEGRPLTQLQQIDLLTMAVMAYHDELVQVLAGLSVEALIEEARPGSGA